MSMRCHRAVVASTSAFRSSRRETLHGCAITSKPWAAAEPGDAIAPPPGTFSYEQGGDRQFATPLARGLEVLRCFTPLEPLLGNKEISVRPGLPKPTVSRLTYPLTKLGYLRHNM